MVSEERFDKIRYYLRHSLYPQGADRSEKSRLRSAATHYKLVGGQDGVPEKLMLKDKEVISDPQAQYEIAKQIHLQAHGGINKTTAIIATKYHWVRIKETVSHVIKNCPECKDTNKPPIIRSEGTRPGRSKTIDEPPAPVVPPAPAAPEVHPSGPPDDLSTNHLTDHDFTSIQQPMDLGSDHLTDNDAHLGAYDDMAIDPQIMEQLQAQLASEYEQHPHAYVQPGMPQYADTSHLPPHDHHDFSHQPPDHQFMHDPSSAMIAHDHVMDDGNNGSGLSNMQPIQHVLPMDYMNPPGGQQYKQ